MQTSARITVKSQLLKRGIPRMGVAQNGWCVRENPIKIDDFSGFVYFRKPQFGKGHVPPDRSRSARYAELASVVHRTFDALEGEKKGELLAAVLQKLWLNWWVTLW